MQAVSAKPMSPSGQQGQPSQPTQEVQSPRSNDLLQLHQGHKTSEAHGSENHSNLMAHGPSVLSTIGLVLRSGI